jgi:hypothetical protein
MKAETKRNLKNAKFIAEELLVLPLLAAGLVTLIHLGMGKPINYGPIPEKTEISIPNPVYPADRYLEQLELHGENPLYLPIDRFLEKYKIEKQS